STFPGVRRPWRAPVAAALCLLLAGGCGGAKLYQVHGKVIFPDGTPLNGGAGVFCPPDKKAPLGPRGGVREDGTFRVSTFREGDGAPEGAYRVLITPLELGNPAPPAPFAKRYRSFETSGLEYTVKPGENEFFKITVEKRQPKGGA